MCGRFTATLSNPTKTMMKITENVVENTPRKTVVKTVDKKAVDLTSE
jgi:hypothetical protein